MIIFSLMCIKLYTNCWKNECRISFESGEKRAHACRSFNITSDALMTKLTFISPSLSLSTICEKSSQQYCNRFDSIKRITDYESVLCVMFAVCISLEHFCECRYRKSFDNSRFNDCCILFNKLSAVLVYPLSAVT